MAKRRGHGEGAIFQRKTGVGSAGWPSQTASARPVRQDAQGSHRQAEKRAEGLEDGVDLSADRKTVAQYLDKWLAASRQAVNTAQDVYHLRVTCRTAIVPRIGSKKLAKLTALDLQVPVHRPGGVGAVAAIRPPCTSRACIGRLSRLSAGS